MKIKPTSFGLAGGIIWGLALFIVTLASLGMPGYGTDFLNVVIGLYPGFEVSGMGSVIGLVYGFIDGFIACYIFALLYNYFEKKFKN